MIGGQSRRMGRHKAMITIDGVPQVIRLHQLMSGLLHQEPVICGSGETGMNHMVRSTDRAPNSGPLSGLLGAYDQFGAVDALVVACDYFRLEDASLEWLLKHNDDRFDVIMPRFPKRDVGEPLLTIYKASAWPILEQAYSEGIRSLLQACQGCKIATPTIPDHLQQSMTSANTPQEFQELR